MTVIDSNGWLEKISDQFFIDYYLKHFPRIGYKFEMIDVCINSIIPLTNFVYEKRLANAKIFLALYEKHSIKIFSPCIYYNSSGQKCILAPPVIEKRSGENILCDGTHRIFSIMEKGEQNIRVLHAYNYDLPLPGDKNTWDNVKIMPEWMPYTKNFINYNEVGLTGYSKFFNSELFTSFQTSEKF